MKSKFLLAVLIFSFLAFTGCSLNIFGTKNKATAQKAGIFKSIDKGVHWTQKSSVPTISGKPESISIYSIQDIVFDPQDFQALYLKTFGSGMWYSYDSGEQWFQAKIPGVNQVEAIIVHPFSKCTLFISSGGKIFKSTDCSRSWKQMYIEARTNVTITSLNIDKEKSDTIFAGTNAGDILLSYDSGDTWQRYYHFDVPRGKSQSVKQLLIDPRDTSMMYAIVGTQLFVSATRGTEWKNITKNFKKFGGGNGLREVFLDFSMKNRLFLINKYGIIHSEDAGENWNALKLVTPPKKVDIRAFAVNSQNNKELYYGVDNKVYRSIDGGENWEVQKFSTTSKITKLKLNPEDANVLYAGLYVVEEKK